MNRALPIATMLAATLFAPLAAADVDVHAGPANVVTVNSEWGYGCSSGGEDHRMFVWVDSYGTRYYAATYNVCSGYDNGAGYWWQNDAFEVAVGRSDAYGWNEIGYGWWMHDDSSGYATCGSHAMLYLYDVGAPCVLPFTPVIGLP